MSNYYSSTKILNDVYSGEALNVMDYASGTNVLNAVYDEENGALKVNVSGFTGGSVDVSYDEDLYYTSEDVLHTPSLAITGGLVDNFQMLDTATGLPYNIHITNGVLSITAV